MLKIVKVLDKMAMPFILYPIYLTWTNLCADGVFFVQSDFGCNFRTLGAKVTKGAKPPGPKPL